MRGIGCGVPDLTRLLMTGDAVGGVWRYTMELARGFSAAGVGMVLAVVGPPPSAAQAAEAAAIAGLRLVVCGLPLDWVAANEAELREMGAVLAGLAARQRVTSVHLHAPALAAEVAWPAPVAAVAHFDVGTWWDAVHGGEMPEHLAWRAAAVGRGLAEADVAVAPSRSFARALDRRYRPGRPITVIRNGRTPPGAIEQPRAAVVLAAGRLWDEGKNLTVLDRAASSLRVPVLAAGPLTGPNGTRVELPHLHTLGTLGPAELAAEMAAATVFVAPSRYEPFGLAVLVAAQAGMALALADIPTFRELWEGAALFFHPDDAGALADAVQRLLEHPMRPAGRAQARAADYSADAMVNATLALHRGLAGERTAQSA